MNHKGGDEERKGILSNDDEVLSSSSSGASFNGDDEEGLVGEDSCGEEEGYDEFDATGGYLKGKALLG